MNIQMICMLLSLFAKVTWLGTTPLPISWQKGGVECVRGDAKLLWQFVHIGEITYWGGALHSQTLHYVVLNLRKCKCLVYLTWLISHVCVLENIETCFQGLIVLQEIEDFKFLFLISLCNVENHCRPLVSIFVVRNQCEWWFCHEIAKGGDCKDPHLLIGLFREQTTFWGCL